MVFAVLVGSAFAQDVVLEDFTGPTGSWFVSEGTGLFLDPPVPFDGRALQCTPVAGSDLCSLFSSTRFPITHDTVQLQVSTDDPLGATTTVAMLSDFGAPEVPVVQDGVASGGWTPFAVDASAGCGEWYRFEIAHEAEGTTWIDQIVTTGEVCPQLLDLDLDGLCPRGIDRDGDGTCAAVDELADPGVVVECNEDLPGARCLTLTQDPLIVGQRATFRVDGANEGEKVVVVWGPAAGRSCPPQLGVTCLDVANATIIRQAFADVNGHAEFTIRVPPAAGGQTLYTQAVVVRFATPPDVSEVLVTPVP